VRAGAAGQSDRPTRESESSECRGSDQSRSGSGARETGAASYREGRSESEIDTAFASLVERHVGALFVAGDPFFYTKPEQFVALASRHAIPAMYMWPHFAEAGGLIGYGINNIAVWHQVGIYAGKILNGAKPADLPVQ